MWLHRLLVIWNGSHPVWPPKISTAAQDREYDETSPPGLRHTTQGWWLNLVSPKLTCWGSNPPVPQKVTLCGSRVMTGHEVVEGAPAPT